MSSIFICNMGIEGKNYTLSNFCDKLGLKYQLIYDRVTKLKWKIEEAICQ